MKFGIVVFPGTWSDKDTEIAIDAIDGACSEFLWHKQEHLNNCDVIVLPGGFSYGDYLRAGAIARFSPIMKSVINFARDGGTVIGICNGFQILCESNLLPGLLVRNASTQFRCQWTHLKVSNRNTLFTHGTSPEKDTLKIPISHGEGNYQAHESTLKALQDNDQIVFQYASENGEMTVDSNPNGSLLNIAGIQNEQGNVLGMMPHPERAYADLNGSTDGLAIFKSVCSNDFKKLRGVA